MRQFFIGYDLGKEQDFSALSLLERVGNQVHLVGLLRFPPRTDYLVQLDVLDDLLAFLGPDAQVSLAVDASGPGQLAVEEIRRRHPGLDVDPVVITAGKSARDLPGGRRAVPRAELIGNMRRCLESGVLRVAGGLEWESELERELDSLKN